jgi:hypothetical protein
MAVGRSFGKGLGDIEMTKRDEKVVVVVVVVVVFVVLVVVLVVGLLVVCQQYCSKGVLDTEIFTNGDDENISFPINNYCLITTTIIHDGQFLIISLTFKRINGTDLSLHTGILIL